MSILYFFRHKISKDIYCLNPEFTTFGNTDSGAVVVSKVVPRVFGDTKTYSLPYITMTITNIIEMIDAARQRAKGEHTSDLQEFTNKALEFTYNYEIVEYNTHTGVTEVLDEADLRLFEAIKR
jgi:hypothetical protein